MDTIRRCRENGNFTPGADGSGLCRTVLHLFLLLACAQFCGQVVTAEAATSSGESEATATDIPSTGVKRPLPARMVLPNQKAPAVTEKKPDAAEMVRPAPVEKRADSAGSAIIKPLPSRTTTSDLKPSAAVRAEDVPLSGAEPTVKAAAQRKPEGPSTGEKHPLPVRSVTTELNLPPAAKAGEKRAPAPEADLPASGEKRADGLSTGEKRPLPLRSMSRDQAVSATGSAESKKSIEVESDQQTPVEKKADGTWTGEKRPLPARTLGVELKTPATGSREAKKPLDAENQPIAPVEKIVAAPSNVEKRPLPPRSATADQGEPMTVKAGAKKMVDGEANRAVDHGTTGELSAEAGVIRPLPARTLSTGQKSPVVSEGKKPLGVEKPRSLPVEPKIAAPASVEKHPLPNRTVLNDRTNTDLAQLEQKKPLAPAQRQPVPVANNVEAPIAVAKKPLPAPVMLHEQKTAALAKGDATKSPAVKKPLSKEQAPAAVPGQKQRPEVVGATAGSWTIVVGSYLLENALAADQARVKKAGLTGLVRPGDKKMTPMNRLLLAEYDDRVAAQAALDKLKRHTSDAFILDHGGKHAVYAGSYLLDSRAAFEKNRLGAAGFDLTLKRVEVAIPSKSLTAGSFSDQKTAEAAMNRLNAAGIKATLVRQ